MTVSKFKKKSLNILEKKGKKKSGNISISISAELSSFSDLSLFQSEMLLDDLRASSSDSDLEDDEGPEINVGIEEEGEESGEESSYSDDNVGGSDDNDHGDDDDDKNDPEDADDDVDSSSEDSSEDDETVNYSSIGMQLRHFLQFLILQFFYAIVLFWAKRPLKITLPSDRRPL